MSSVWEQVVNGHELLKVAGQVESLISLPFGILNFVKKSLHSHSLPNGPLALTWGYVCKCGKNKMI